MRKERLGLWFAILTITLWGPWGAWIDLPAAAGFPETLGYVVWSLTMIVPAVVALSLVKWKLEYNPRAVIYGCAAGLLGAGGQLILFKALRLAPAYLVFPFISLSPAVTILMAALITRERTSRRGWIGIGLALVAGALLSWSKPTGDATVSKLWVLLALLVLGAWGVQGFILSHANRCMKAESIFFYMTVTAILLSPVALGMTDFSKPIAWNFRGAGLAALVQSLNSVGALLLVYAFRYGKAIIVSPLTNAGAPVITVVIALLMNGTKPLPLNVIGIILAISGITLMTLE
jgi:drug/metabolite transporter (DMT)-like permease